MSDDSILNFMRDNLNGNCSINKVLLFILTITLYFVLFL